VGLSKLFHEDMHIVHLFNLLKKSTNHESYSEMSCRTKQWWLDNMKFVVLQVIDAEGDVVLLCNRGHSRSPMYLVAYLVVMYNMRSCAAMKCVGKLLLEQRGEVLDRYGSLKPVIDLIAL
jgi:hypothetical protein